MLPWSLTSLDVKHTIGITSISPMFSLINPVNITYKENIFGFEISVTLWTSSLFYLFFYDNVSSSGYVASTCF
jgi:hypothetical protein